MTWRRRGAPSPLTDSLRDCSFGHLFSPVSGCEAVTTLIFVLDMSQLYPRPTLAPDLISHPVKDASHSPWLPASRATHSADSSSHETMRTNTKASKSTSFQSKIRMLVEKQPQDPVIQSLCLGLLHGPSLHSRGTVRSPEFILRVAVIDRAGELVWWPR